MENDIGKITTDHAAEFDRFVTKINRQTVTDEKGVSEAVIYRLSVTLTTRDGEIRRRVCFYDVELQDVMNSLVALNETTKLMSRKAAGRFLHIGASISFSQPSEGMMGMTSTPIRMHRIHPRTGKLEAVITLEDSALTVGFGPRKNAKYLGVYLNKPMKSHLAKHSKMNKAPEWAKRNPRASRVWMAAKTFFKRGAVGAATIVKGLNAFGGAKWFSTMLGALEGLVYKALGIYTYGQHAKRMTAYYRSKFKISSE